MKGHVDGAGGKYIYRWSKSNCLTVCSKFLYLYYKEFESIAMSP